jgi:MFS family permease
MVITFLVVGVLVLVGFVIFELRTSEPMLPMGLFRSHTFTGANLLTFLLYGALGGALFFVPFNLVQVQHYSATAAGAALLPFILIMFLLSRWSGGLIVRYGARKPLVVGPTIVAVGFALFALPGIGGSYWLTFFPAAVVLGLGMAVTVAPLTTAVMGSVEEKYVGIASGINNAAARAAGLLAIAVLGIVMAGVFGTNLERDLNATQLPAQVRQQVVAQRAQIGNIKPPDGVSEQEATAITQVVDNSFVAGFRVVMLVSAVLAVLSAVAAWLLIADKKK